MEILPTTKVNELLQEFPQLEEVLITLDPKFKKLKNPLLRNSIGRVATLKQAALVAEIPCDIFIEHLRKAAGKNIATE
ncbi:MAG: hypothetical protein Tsb0014_31440 [Pleurocapsa sp.]